MSGNRAGGAVIALGVVVTLAEFANYYLRPAPLTWPVLYFASLVVVVGLAFTDSVKTLAASAAVRDVATTAGGILGAFRGRGGVVQAAIPAGTTAVLTREGAPDVVVRDGEPPVEARQTDPPAEAPAKVAKRKAPPKGASGRFVRADKPLDGLTALELADAEARVSTGLGLAGLGLQIPVEPDGPAAVDADGDESEGDEQIDASELPEAPLPLQVAALMAPAGGRAGPGDWLSANFRASEYTVSGRYPHLVVPVPKRYEANVKRHAQTILQPLRIRAGRPLLILSGYRAPTLNAAVTGSATSQHLTASAADVTCDGVESVFLALLTGEIVLRCGQVIFYPAQSFIHLGLPSAGHPAPSFHVHWPQRGQRYRRVRTVGEYVAATGRTA